MSEKLITHPPDSSLTASRGEHDVQIVEEARLRNLVDERSGNDCLPQQVYMEKRRKVGLIKKRARMLEVVRSFFKNQGYLEVDLPSILKYPNLDLNIEPIECYPLKDEKGFLHTSPEYAMKKLLGDGGDKIYFLGHVFRKNELGRLHNTEFTMVEWYQKNTTFDLFLKEILSFLALFLNYKKFEIIYYEEAFAKFASVNIHNKEKLIKVAKNFIQNAEKYDITTLRQLILSQLIEPKLGDGVFSVLCDFPKEEAALAKTIFKNGKEVSERFEIYFQGIELVNGYHELDQGEIQRKRFALLNEERKKIGLDNLIVDEEFLRSLDSIGDCYGVSAGFDRLLMLKLGCKSIKDVIHFNWNNLISS